MDFFQELSLNAKRVREKINMSHPVNTTIQEELVEMIAQMRPDLALEEAEQCFHDTWNEIQEGGMKYATKFIASWNRGGNDEPY